MPEAPAIAAARTHASGPQEAARIGVVERLGLLAASSPHLDVVVRQAARVMDTAIGAVTVLVRDEQHLIARTGIEACVTDRTTSFCTHVTARQMPITIRDATRAPFFAGSPAVGFTPESLRAYCGVPIATPDGTVVAVLCVADARPRHFSTEQVATLEQLAARARAILLPVLAEPPAPPSPAVVRPVEDEPAWCGQDDLYQWIAGTVPEEATLATLARCRARDRWSSPAVVTRWLRAPSRRAARRSRSPH
ncbi:MAG: hypothetical protein JWM98_2213 [Thermoleophilia bacterium]|nr:hypothetical protein [Thermoleophilia bacterium]